MFETECAPCRHRISKARENVAWALYVFYFLKDTYADVGPYSYSILKQSEAKPKKMRRRPNAHQITENDMYNRAVLVIHVRQTSVTDCGDINFVVKH